MMSAGVHPVNFVPQKFLDTFDGLVCFHGIVSQENGFFFCITGTEEVEEMRILCFHLNSDAEMKFLPIQTELKFTTSQKIVLRNVGANLCQRCIIRTKKMPFWKSQC